MNTALALIILLGGLLLVSGVIAGFIVLLRRLFRAPPQPRSRPPGRSPEASPTGLPAGSPAPAGRLPYALTPRLLTDAERAFYEVLRSAVPSDLEIFPQVRLANLVHVVGGGKQRKYDFYRIQAKCVDFVLCERGTTAPRLVVELDDSSHARADRRQRDAFVDAVLGDVGLPVLHVRWQPAYRADELAAQISTGLGRRVAPLASPRPATEAGGAYHRPAPLQPAEVRPLMPLAPTRPVAPQVLTAQPATVIADAPARDTSWACGQCQREVQRAARYCGHCGAALGT
jgi:hypothetical protein